MVFSADALPDRAALQKTFNSGNYKDAYEGFRRLALDPKSTGGNPGSDLKMAIAALRSLGRTSEVDPLRDEVVKVHAKNWRLLWTAAETYLEGENYGFIVAGKFERGQHRGGGRLVNSAERDRVRALQLMVEAMPLANNDNNKGEVSNFFLALARLLMGNRGYSEAWRLQYLTDLSTLPDYDEGWYYGRSAPGAPVGEDGQPIYHFKPRSWEVATTDGERWRWAMEQAVEMSPGRRNEVRMLLAEFLEQQFGVQTMAHYGYFFGRAADDDGKEANAGIFALHTLGEDETIARLATGIKRFKLPDEFNFIKIYQQVADSGKSGHGDRALQHLAQVFENRRQYPQAAEFWRRTIKEYGPGPNNYKQQRLDQIVGNWCRFESIMTQPAGKGATIEFRFRNGKSVEFTAQEINVEKLLNDTKTYLRNKPRQVDWQKINIADFGYQLVTQNQQQYLGAKMAQWTLELEPREKHFDKRITVTTPLQRSGAYLLTARLANGNTSQIIVWLADMAIVKKPLAGKTLYFVADAITGKPVERANVEFFGWRQRHIRNNEYQVDVSNFAEFTNRDGQVTPDLKQQPSDHQWLIVARTEAGRFAYLGFTGVWQGQYYDAEYNQTKVFTITDRPVYRPEQTVKFKFWVRHAKYDQEDTSSFASQTFKVEIHNPKGEKVLEKSFETDAFGGAAGELALPSGAPLGVYQIQVINYGGGTFRVEEYKKPEFEVLVEAPKKPIMLGEKITGTIKAKYYFGAPVVKAKVKYKVLRTSYRSDWYPQGPWDWFYGPGYWWFAYDYVWYPGWREWGCFRPIPWWWGGRGGEQPEVVAEREVEIGADGTVKVDIDTALAKEIHSDQDHQYSITAEVVDESRRTIVGTGNVLVARRPFKVFAWVDRGYYRAGDVVNAQFQAHTLDQQPIEGKGVFKLLKITYDQDQKPVEHVVLEQELSTNAEGRAQLQVKAAEAGQYRISYTLTDREQHSIEGGYIFTVIGQGADAAQFRFNEIELTTEKKEYEPGEKVRLAINTNRENSTVLVFLRPANGVYLPPVTLRLDGKTAVHEFEITKKDMPNLFVEAVTLSSGKVYSEMREIVVPPAKRVLDVAITPSSEIYKPGEKAKVKLNLTDSSGNPFVGSTVVAIYDKALEYISGGSNVPEIKAFFWKWRRHHHPQTESSLNRGSYNLARPNQPGMSDLGVFGGAVAEGGEWGSDKGGDGVAMNAVRGGFARGEAKAATFGRANLRDSNGAMDAMPAAAPMAAAEQQLAGGGQGGGGGQPAVELVQPIIRSKFADTAFWAAAITTDSNGLAEVSLDMPENLTTWKIRVWGMGHGTKVGEGATEVITRKDLIVRMQTPRFFVERDEVVLSANVHNYLDKKKSVQVVIEADGGTLSLPNDTKRTIDIGAGDEARVDWRVRVAAEGRAVIRMKALTDADSDAMEMTFPVYVHGMLKTEAWSVAIRPEGDSAKIAIRVPAERRISQTRLEIRYSPTLAGAMVDALPYLVDYPYDSTDQTLNRFLPTVITQRVLQDMGLDLREIEKKRTNLNAQEIGDDEKRAEGWKRYERNPVFDTDEVDRMVKQGVQRLQDMQLSDGGWGWFYGGQEYSTPHTTAYVVHGLQIAVKNDVALVPGVMERGVAWLKRYQDDQVKRLKNFSTKTRPYKEFADNLDAFVYMVLVDAKVKNEEMMDFLFRDRTYLAVYTKGMIGLALHAQGETQKLNMVLQNIEQYVMQDNENQTAYLQLPENNYWWFWYGSEYEAHAYYLKLLARTNPQSEKASRLVKYLINNRKHATYWNATRDTAIVIEALAEYLKASSESRPDLTVQILVDGKQKKEVKINAENLFSFDNKLVLEGDALDSGEHLIEVRKSGKGPLYCNAYLTNFTQEDDITRAGLEIKVNRKFYRLVKVEKTIKVTGSRGQAVDQKVEKYERQELANLATLKSGELVEVELEIDSKNDYEYLLFEDMKAAGFETVEQRSGYNGNSLGAYMELRDNRVAFLVRALARGKHSVSYRLRAETPGKFSALPSVGTGVYAPELKANSDEIKLRIED